MIAIVPATGSTNADLAARLGAGEPLAEGDWLVADRQTAGRGRLGRVWSDGAGNFMGSTVVRIASGDPPPATLALVAGLAVQGCVAALLPPTALAMLKWPNDVLGLSAGGAPAKLAGVLLERVGDHVIAGIGVNLVSAPEISGRPAASLAQLGAAVARDAFAGALAERFAEDLRLWRHYGLGPVLVRWQAAAHPVGTPLTVNGGADDALAGRYAGLDEHGALRLALADGTTRTVQSGDVMLG